MYSIYCSKLISFIIDYKIIYAILQYRLNTQRINLILLIVEILGCVISSFVPSMMMKLTYVAWLIILCSHAYNAFKLYGLSLVKIFLVLKFTFQC